MISSRPIIAKRRNWSRVRFCVSVSVVERHPK
jgi:hypothetical protein